MKRILGVLSIIVLLSTSAAFSQTTELFFSEYIEGSSLNKALEIYNGTGSDVDLLTENYSIEIYFNGSTSPSTTILLTGIITDGDVYVVADDGANAAILAETDQTSTSNFFNGDDAVALLRNGLIIDVIGQIGVDPGSQWGAGDVSTQNNNLRRMAQVDAGDPDGNDPFDPYMEWDGFAQDTFDGLGTHSVSDVYTPIYDIQYTSDPSGDSPYMDQIGVTTEGIVTAVFYNGYFIEDPAGGPWSGMWVYDSSAPAQGDRVRITGTVTEYNNLTEMESLTDFVVVSSNNPIPDPAIIPTGDVSQEQWEGVLVKVEYVTVIDDDLGYGEWSVSDGSGDVVIDDKGSYTYTPATGDMIVSLTGPVDYSFGAFKILPRDDADIVFSAPATIIINEIHADPATDASGDANGDGVRDSSDDEFVEIANDSDSDVDISGWTLSDGYGLRHEFPAGTVIPAQCVIVVFGGGTPTDAFGNALVQTASTGSLGLNNGGDTVTLSDGMIQVSATYGSEGGNNQSLTRDPDLSGIYVQHTTAIGAAGALFSPGTMVDGTPFSGCAPIAACGNPATLIHDVQGNGTSSPLKDSTVEIEGVVVGDFQTSDNLRGFFVQEEDLDTDGDPATSEGIFVYDGSSPAVDVAIGDVVHIQGTVDEQYGLTELTSISSVEICSSGASVSPATVTLPLVSVDDWERYEGMLINIPQTLYATGNYSQGRYGEVDLSVGARLLTPTNVAPPGPMAIAMQAQNDLSRIQMDDGSTVKNPQPLPPYIGDENTLRAGDNIPELTGVLGYGYGVYEVHPTESVEFTRVNQREATPPDTAGNLNIASFNVLNYFTSIDDGTPICGPSEDMDCRGADSTEEFTRQRDKIISAITAMNADIIGLIEIENHATDEALQDLVIGLNDAAGPGTYDAIPTGPIGTDAIKVAFIYKPAAVTPMGVHAILDSSVDPTFNDEKNRPALAQTFKQNTTKEILTVVVNHLKSKGSPCDDLGDPDTGDGQGNCNLTRTAAAQALVNWLATDPTGSGDKDFLILGDLNAYALENPITAILAGGYTDLIDAFNQDAYSYVYYGQAGYLDHALASPELTRQVAGTTIWHVNADEPAALDYNDYNQSDLYNADPYRSSDHDPVIVSLNLLTVHMDIKPGSCKNPVNVKSRGVLPVAVLGTEYFDVRTIDPNSLALQGVAPLRWAYKDVTKPEKCGRRRDGHKDLILKFRTKKIVAALGDISDGDKIPLTLTGRLKEAYGGYGFVSEDMITILKKGKKRRR